ncbi:MAG: hypothetical protein IPM39_27745 [Chloroflexi bacterium]|nr:hypothetical protein [Chloroflexota bacterium]
MTGTFSALVAMTKSAEAQPTPPGADGTAAAHQRVIGAAAHNFTFITIPRKPDDREVDARTRTNVKPFGVN